MATVQFQPPPTYADPVLVEEGTKRARFNPLWLKWFLDISNFISASSTPPSHNSLSNIQGGNATEAYHLTSAERTAINSGNFPHGITVGNTNHLIATSVDLVDASSTATCTLTNGPVGGDPTKWITINDNGTPRRIPTW